MPNSTPPTGNDNSPPPNSSNHQDPQVTLPRPNSTSLVDLWGTDFDTVSADETLKPPAERYDGADDSPRKKPPRGKRPNPPDSVDLGGYDLLEVLGEGGVGIVYQARQKSIDRDIAVKMMKSASPQNTQRKRKFVREALVTGKLDHPNIVPIHDLGETADGQPFYTMKMVRGRPWSEVLRNNSLDANLRILLDVCDAAAFAHSKGVIHRDLKPENVMLGEFGEVQLMDWGLGATIDADGIASHLKPREAAGGTPAYMAPEMVTGQDGPVGLHSDIYLLGAILYELIAGRAPHAGPRVLACLQGARENRILPVDNGGVLLDIALRAMATNPADRYRSVQDLKRALLDYQAHAESIRLCQRSHAELEQARQTRDYETFTRARFGFREALDSWPDNQDADRGLEETQLAYARCAYEKRDYDLADSLLLDECESHRALAADVRQAQLRRDQARRRLRALRLTALGLTAAVIVTLTVSAWWIAGARKQERRAKEAAQNATAEAVQARLAETEQRRLAEVASAQAQAEEERARKALAELEQAVGAMMQAQSHEEQAQARARTAELVATQTRDELARTGMLLDSSWWAFANADAEARRQAAAERIGQPAQLTIPLAGDVDLDLVLIPDGEFVMGSPPPEESRAADEYLHRVHITQPFYIATYELTEAQWAAITGNAPACAADRTPDERLPVTGVSYEDTVTRLLPAMQKHAPRGYAFRLPTEAEWEYACRAGTPTAYSAGDGDAALDTCGWYLTNSARRVRPVGLKHPNAFGLYDLHGNVSELCGDEYRAGFYLESPTADPLAELAGDHPIVRGGSVFNTAAQCRSAYRSYAYHQNRYEFLGLRPILAPTNDQPAP